MKKSSVRLPGPIVPILIASLMVLSLSACRGYAPETKVDDGKATANKNAASSDSSKDSPSAKPSDYGYNNGAKTTPAVANGQDEGVAPSEQVAVPTPVTGASSNGKELEPGQILANGLYLIKNSSSKKCMHVPDAKRDNDIKLVQATCDEKADKFTIDFVEHKYYRITNTANSKSLEISDELAQDEATVEQSDYLGQAYQQWIILKQDDGSYWIKPRDNTNLCLDVIYASEADGAGLQIWHECTGASQKWLLAPLY